MSVCVCVYVSGIAIKRKSFLLVILIEQRVQHCVNKKKFIIITDRNEKKTNSKEKKQNAYVCFVLSQKEQEFCVPDSKAV